MNYQCAVSLDNFNQDDEYVLILLPIRNSMVDSWLLKNPNCQICRTTTDSQRFGDDIHIDVSLQKEKVEG